MKRILIIVSLLAVLYVAFDHQRLFAAANTQFGKTPAVTRLATWLKSITGNVVNASEPMQGQFPTLEDQLRISRARSGTALEQLIKDNQDFTLLRADESKDNRGLPPWLRVWWRKAHPDMKYPADDPTGGYPLVLKEILEWMEWHQDLKPGMGTPPSSGSSFLERLIKDDDEEEEAAEAQRLLAPNSTVTGEQRISGAQTTPRSESDIRINFFDPTKILSASNSITGGGHQAIFYSTNSGASWGQTVLPFTSTDTSHSDPTAEWTSDGSAWSSTIGIVGSTLRMRNYVSADNGAT